jgi:phosphoribosylanthranilate isomerase
MRIKVCCIQSLEEAQLALGCGAHALGFVSEMPSGPGTIADSEIREIIARIPPTYSTVLLSSRTDPRSIVEHQRETGANTLQLVSAVCPEDLDRLRENLPGIAVLKVIHVQNESSIELASSYSKSATAILLDTGNPEARIPKLGGTGLTHDWSISRRIVETCSVPVFLAGGLDPLNVEDAIRHVRPFGVDVCSSLRPRGMLDTAVLRDFISSANRGAA